MRFVPLIENCDVSGCTNREIATGGHWPWGSEDGPYLGLCRYHSNMRIDGLPMPKIKKPRLEREALRGPDGVLPHNWRELRRQKKLAS